MDCRHQKQLLQNPFQLRLRDSEQLHLVSDIHQNPLQFGKSSFFTAKEMADSVDAASVKGLRSGRVLVTDDTPNMHFSLISAGVRQASPAPD